MDKRTLTDDDVRAIVDEMERRATQRFQINVGKGVLGLAWRAMVILLIWLSAYGAGSGWLKKLME